MDWVYARHALANTHVDILCLFDTCDTAGAGLKFVPRSHIELLAASSREGTASGVMDINFTAALTKILEEKGGNPISVAKIHAKLVTQAETNKLSATPVHAELGAKLSGTILLAKLNGPTTPTVELSEDATLKVLVSLHLEEPASPPNREQWARLLTSSVPSNLKDMGVEIVLEGVFDSTSVIVLLSMPIEVYTILEKIGPYRYCGYVRSSNIILK